MSEDAPVIASARELPVIENGPMPNNGTEVLVVERDAIENQQQISDNETEMRVHIEMPNNEPEAVVRSIENEPMPNNGTEVLVVQRDASENQLQISDNETEMPVRPNKMPKRIARGQNRIRMNIALPPRYGIYEIDTLKISICHLCVWHFLLSSNNSNASILIA